MKRITTCLLLLGLFACNGGESQEVEDLTRRVSQLEKKVKSLEQVAKGGRQGQRGKAKAGSEKTAKSGGKEKAGAEKSGKGGKAGGDASLATVTAEGDASRVVLAQGKKRVPVPGKAAAGTYTVMAAFGEAPLAKAGEITVEAKQDLTVTCSSTDKTCAGG